MFLCSMDDCDLSEFITLHDGNWVDIRRFCTNLKYGKSKDKRVKRVPQEKIFILRPSRVVRDIRDPAREIGGRTCVTLRGLMIYLLHHEDDIDIISVLCQKVLKAISSCCAAEDVRDEGSGCSILNIYQRVAKANVFMSIPFEEDLSEENLMVTHKDKFNAEEWKQIKLFEHYFELQNKGEQNAVSSEEKIRAKQGFLDSLIKAKNLDLEQEAEIPLNLSKGNKKVSHIKQQENREIGSLTEEFS